MQWVRLLSPRELADALGVSESSLKRWVDAGKIVAARTDGGHRRITLQEAVRFIRETGAPLARPELLDMPDISAVRAGDDAFRHYLVEGDATSARGWLLARYLSGASVASLCDGPIKEAMHRIGELWQHDPEGIFIEHRATDACIQALAQLRATFEPSPTAPFALGATPEDDPYLMPAFMAAMIVASEGLRSVNLGPDTPVGAMQRAYAWHKPTLVWVSASAPLAPERARAIEQWLLTLPSTTVVLVGGRHGHQIGAGRLRYIETMQQLGEAAASVLANASPVSRAAHFPNG
jgi:excisionase family DNA binding protein